MVVEYKYMNTIMWAHGMVAIRLVVQPCSQIPFDRFPLCAHQSRGGSRGQKVVIHGVIHGLSARPGQA